MSTIAEIKAAVEKLSLSERAEFAKWFNGWGMDDWDSQISSDFGPGGRYEHVLKEVDKEIQSGDLRDMP